MGKVADELTLRNLNLDHAEPQDFYRGRFKNNALYLSWRMFWAIYHTCWLGAGLVVTSLDDDLHLDKWFIYLSNWVYLVLFIDGWMECGIVLREYVGKTAPTSQSRRMSLATQVTWCLSYVTSVACVMVTLWYWTWIGRGKPVTALRLHYHGINALYILLNMLVSKFPFRLLHAVYPVTFGVAYTAFSATYFAVGGTNQQGDPYIYKVLDWSRPGRTFALSCLSNFLFIPVVHVSLWLLRLAVKRLESKMFKMAAVSHDRMDNEVPDSESEDRFHTV